MVSEKCVKTALIHAKSLEDELADNPTERVRKLRAQADEYAFPYHYIPQPFGRLWMARHWEFGPSYVAALELVLERLEYFARKEGAMFQHIDIGCGDGALLHHLIQINPDLAPHLTGVDTDARPIEWAKMFNPSVDFRSADVSELGEAFSSASMIEVAEHIPVADLPDFLATTAKILKPGGKLILTVPSVEKNLYDKHFQHFSMKSLRTALETSFTEIDIKGFEHRDRLTKFLHRLRTNSQIRIDAPQLNRILVNRLSTLHDTQEGCGRLLAIATKT